MKFLNLDALQIVVGIFAMCVGINMETFLGLGVAVSSMFMTYTGFLSMIMNINKGR